MYEDINSISYIVFLKRNESRRKYEQIKTISTPDVLIGFIFSHLNHHLFNTNWILTYQRIKCYINARACNYLG